MSLQADALPSESERAGWKRGSEIRGKRITLVELGRLFPETKSRGPIKVVETADKYDAIGRRVVGSSVSSERLAYECGGCGGIFGGPPIIKEDSKVSDVNWDMYCHGCGTHLAESLLRGYEENF